MILQWVLAALVIAGTFLVLIAPHEGGHFAVAKLCKVRVIEFSVGMGPRLLSAVRDRTLYAFRLLPIGGYVRLGGMEPGDYSDPNGFHARPAYQRVLVLLAGPVVNFLIASLVITGISLTHVGGDPGSIVGVEPGTPALAGGLKAGDVIQRVNGQPLHSSADIRKIEQDSPGQPLRLVVRHPDGKVQELVVTPKYDQRLHAYLIGIDSAPSLSVGEALKIGATFPITTSGLLFQGMYMLVSGQIPGGPLGPEGVTGPVGIAALSSQQAQSGLGNWLEIVALLSVALGLFNLLPLPALDGGRIVVVLAEKLRGHPFDRDREMRFQRAGLVALLGLVAVITYFDFQRLVNHQFPGLK